jgi:hypothetical protein
VRRHLSPFKSFVPAMAVRLCVVDDTDERLAYEGNWSLKLEGVGDVPESSGPSVNYTTHVLPSGDGSVDFKFNGMSTSSHSRYVD